MHCDVRTTKTSVCARTNKVVATHTVALTAVVTRCVRISRLQLDFVIDGDSVKLVVSNRLAPISWILVRLLRQTWEKIFLTLCLPVNWYLCQLGVDDDELRHGELGDQLDEEDDCGCSFVDCPADLNQQNKFFNYSFLVPWNPGVSAPEIAWLLSSLLRKWNKFMLFWSLLLRRSCVRVISCIIFPSVPNWSAPLLFFYYLIPGYFLHQNWLETCESLLQYQKEFALVVDPENTDCCVFLPICTINFWSLDWAATYWILGKYSTHIQVAHHLFCPRCSLPVNFWTTPILQKFQYILPACRIWKRPSRPKWSQFWWERKSRTIGLYQMTNITDFLKKWITRNPHQNYRLYRHESFHSVKNKKNGTGTCLW